MSTIEMYMFLKKLRNYEYAIFEKLYLNIYDFLIDSENTNKYKETIKFFHLQNISLVDLCVFLIEIQHKNILDYLYSYHNYKCKSFTELDRKLDNYIHDRRSNYINKYDFILDLAHYTNKNNPEQKLSNKSFNIWVCLYKNQILERGIDDIKISIYKYTNFGYSNLFYNLNLSKSDIISKLPCDRCGCSSEFDCYGDKICYCDTCHHTGCYNTINIISNNERNQSDVLVLHLLYKKLKFKLKNKIKNFIMLQFHKIPLDIYRVMKQNNITIIKICDFIIEWKNFKKSQYLLNYKDNSFVNFYKDFQEINTLDGIFEYECKIITNLRRNYVYINSYFNFIDYYFENFLSICSINILSILMNKYFIDNLYYMWLYNVIKVNNLNISDIYLILGNRITNDYKNIVLKNNRWNINTLCIYDNCKCFDKDIRYKLEYLIKFENPKKLGFE